MGWRHRCRHGQRGRLPKPITIQTPPSIASFAPNPQLNPTPILLEPAEVEALRLVDLEELSQEAAGERMGVSRGTIWRLVQGARRKVTQALVEGRPLIVVNSDSAKNP